MNFEPLEQYLHSLEQVGIPACDCIVHYHGKQVFHSLQGYSDVGKTRPTSSDDLYWLFSASKLFTCAAVLQLVEAGKLQLEAPISKYFPAFAGLKVREREKSPYPAKRIPTIRELLSMTGGFDYNLNVPALAEIKKNSHATTVQVIEALAQEPIYFEPSSHYCYSLGHDILAAILEVVADMTFGEYLKTRLFEPLGIGHMGFHPSLEQQRCFSAQYIYSVPDYTATPRPTQNEFIFSPCYESGGAGLFGTAEDYMRFAAALANNGRSSNGVPILLPETIQLMATNQLNRSCLADFQSQPRFYGYGYGMGVRTHMRPEVTLSKSPAGEFGWDGAAGAYVLIDPKISWQSSMFSMFYTVIMLLIRFILIFGIWFMRR